MAVRRSGSPTSFWNNASVAINGTSTAVPMPRGVEQVGIFITVSAPTTVGVQVAHHGALTSEGNEPDHSIVPSAWHLLYYVNSAVQIQFTSAGSAMLMIPDFEPNWVRLISSAAATITAGHEVTGD